MNDTDAMYRTPNADLNPDANNGPKFVLPQPDANKLRLVAILVWIEIMFELPLFAFSFMTGIEPNQPLWRWGTSVGLVICTLLFVYSTWWWRNFLHARLDFYAADGWIALQIIMNIVMLPVCLMLGDGESVPVMATYFVGVVLLGICGLMVSLKLKPISASYPYLGAFRIWLMAQSILMISVIFLLFAMPASLVSGVFLALMLQHASRERREETSQLI